MKAAAETGQGASGPKDVPDPVQTQPQAVERFGPVKELGCGSATTCWRRFDEWAKAGVFEQLQALLLDELGRPAGSTWSASASAPSACGRSRGT